VLVKGADWAIKDIVGAKEVLSLAEKCGASACQGPVIYPGYQDPEARVRPWIGDAVFRGFRLYAVTDLKAEVRKSSARLRRVSGRRYRSASLKVLSDASLISGGDRDPEDRKEIPEALFYE